MMEYEVIVGGSLTDLVTRVNGYTRTGWTPQGGVSCFNDNTTGGVFYMQAITRVVN